MFQKAYDSCPFNLNLKSHYFGNNLFPEFKICGFKQKIVRFKSENFLILITKIWDFSRFETQKSIGFVQTQNFFRIEMNLGLKLCNLQVSIIGVLFWICRTRRCGLHASFIWPSRYNILIPNSSMILK